ncbi:MAG: hypothetical protein PHQ34_11660 [Methanothrix sp.]|nr:hypothetical protein [Methanothrix sp.]
MSLNNAIVIHLNYLNFLPQSRSPSPVTPQSPQALVSPAVGGLDPGAEGPSAHEACGPRGAAFAGNASDRPGDSCDGATIFAFEFFWILMLLAALTKKLAEECEARQSHHFAILLAISQVASIIAGATD